MTVLITLTSAGSDSSIFDLYSDIDGYVVPFETGITKASLLSGYTSTLVPDYTKEIKLQSLIGCTNYINVILSTPIIDIPAPGTTSTTTTTALIICIEYTAGTFSSFGQYVNYIDCNNISAHFYIGGGSGGLVQQTFCAKQGSVSYDSEIFLLENGVCTTTTTTVAPTTTTTTTIV